MALEKPNAGAEEPDRGGDRCTGELDDDAAAIANEKGLAEAATVPDASAALGRPNAGAEEPDRGGDRCTGELDDAAAAIANEKGLAEAATVPDASAALGRPNAEPNTGDPDVETLTPPKGGDDAAKPPKGRALENPPADGAIAKVSGLLLDAGNFSADAENEPETEAGTGSGT